MLTRFRCGGITGLAGELCVPSGDRGKEGEDDTSPRPVAGCEGPGVRNAAVCVCEGPAAGYTLTSVRAAGLARARLRRASRSWSVSRQPSAVINADPLPSFLRRSTAITIESRMIGSVCTYHPIPLPLARRPSHSQAGLPFLLGIPASWLSWPIDPTGVSYSLAPSAFLLVRGAPPAARGIWAVVMYGTQPAGANNCRAQGGAGLTLL